MIAVENDPSARIRLEPVETTNRGPSIDQCMDAQTRVAEFVRTHDLETDPEYRVLDLSAEVGEIAADAVKSSEYGSAPQEMTVSEDELGDALFALLATAEAFDIDAEAALDQSIRKYERRIDESGDAGSA